MAGTNWQNYFKYSKSRELLNQGRLTQEEVDHLMFVLPYCEKDAFTALLDALLDSKKPKISTSWNRTLSLAISYLGVTVKRDAFVVPGLMSQLDAAVQDYIEANWAVVQPIWFSDVEDQTA